MNANNLLSRRKRPTLVWAQSDKAPEPKKLNELYSSTAFARAAGASGTFGLSVYVDAYSTDDEITQLAQILRDKGSDELLEAVSKLKSKGPPFAHWPGRNRRQSDSRAPN
jgi:hypothetical protein